MKKGIGSNYIEDLFSKFIKYDNEIVENVNKKIEKTYETNVRKKNLYEKSCSKNIAIFKQ